jgi:hypothetical protein
MEWVFCAVFGGRGTVVFRSQRSLILRLREGGKEKKKGKIGCFLSEAAIFWWVPDN